MWDVGHYKLTPLKPRRPRQGGFSHTNDAGSLLDMQAQRTIATHPRGSGTLRL